MSDVANVRPLPRFEIRLPDDRTQEVTQPRLRTLIHNGTVNATTSVRRMGSEEWLLAGDVEELRQDLETMALARGTGRNADPDERISRARLVAYMALSGVAATFILIIFAPLCLLIGVFAKFVVTWAAFGAVLALGLTNAAKVEEPRILHITAAGFAVGGLIAWFFHPANGDFTALHLGIIGLVGGAALSYAIKLPKERALIVTVAAAVLFPTALFSIGMFRPDRLPQSLGILSLPLVMLIESIPFAAFGAVIGSLIRWSDADAVAV